MSSPKVSVIVPIYKAEPYIEQCARSLFDQTLADIEYIFIDDCSPDKSVDILNNILTEYPQRIPQIKIIRNERNLGVGQTRQRAIDIASGDFIIHCDPDDWVDTELYEKMWKRAIESKAEIVICSFQLMHNGKSIPRNQIPPNSKREIFTALASGKLHGGLWNKLIKREIAQKFRIDRNINMWEDLSVTPLMLLSANQTTHVSDVYYYYRLDNPHSVSSSYSLKTCQSQINAVESLEKRLQSYGLYTEINPNDMRLLNWNALYILLMSKNIEDYHQWNTLFKKRVKQIPKDNLATRFKILTWLAKNKFYHLLLCINSIKRHK